VQTKLNIKKLKKICKWTPQQKDIIWTEHYLNRAFEAHEAHDGNYGFIWVTSWGSYDILKDEKVVFILDINYGLTHSKWEALDNVGRVTKVLEKLGYEVIMGNGITTINRDATKDRIIGKTTIPKNTPIETLNYNQTFRGDDFPNP